MRTLGIAVLCASLLGCRDSLSSIDLLARELPLAEQSVRSRPSARRVAGIDTLLVVVPTRAAVGETLALTIPVASGGCRDADTTAVAVVQLTATIIPYQRVVTDPNANCPSVYFVERRTVHVTFMARGAARLRIVSRSGADQRLLAIERLVMIE
jgi:hypothetical protein